MRNWITVWLSKLICPRAMAVAMSRDADNNIGPPGDPYLRRWYWLPRNRVLNVYVHQYFHDDDKRAPHDHPWISVSLCLRGSLTEHVFDKSNPSSVRQITAGDVVYRSATFSHRLDVVQPGDTWTLFITGPRIRMWGFWCKSKSDDSPRFVPFDVFGAQNRHTDGSVSSVVSRGCD